MFIYNIYCKIILILVRRCFAMKNLNILKFDKFKISNIVKYLVLIFAFLFVGMVDKEDVVKGGEFAYSATNIETSTSAGTTIIPFVNIGVTDVYHQVFGGFYCNAPRDKSHFTYSDVHKEYRHIADDGVICYQVVDVYSDGRTGVFTNYEQYRMEIEEHNGYDGSKSSLAKLEEVKYNTSTGQTCKRSEKCGNAQYVQYRYARYTIWVLPSV